MEEMKEDMDTVVNGDTNEPLGSNPATHALPLTVAKHHLTRAIQF